jgi:CDP-diacylglycerol--glycerol-3-phosphate 3-phosphatidyltransferase
MSVRAVPAPLAQLPNVLTAARLAAVPVFVALLLAVDGAGSYGLAALFAAAAFTDQLDGWLARRWHVQSEFGKLVDPLADRLMIDSAVVILAVDGRLPWLGAAIVLARDVLLVGGYPFVKRRGYEFAVNTEGKVATWVLYAGVTGLISSDAGTDWPRWLFWAGVGLALAAAALYVLKARREVGRR